MTAFPFCESTAPMNTNTNSCLVTEHPRHWVKEGGKEGLGRSASKIYGRVFVPVVIPLRYGTPRSEKAMFSNTSPLPANQSRYQ